MLVTCMVTVHTAEVEIRGALRVHAAVHKKYLLQLPFLASWCLHIAVCYVLDSVRDMGHTMRDKTA